MKIFLAILLVISIYSNEKKILICGVGRNVAHSISSVIRNVEALQVHFSDYRVVIYENNSGDLTKQQLSQWALDNKKILIECEEWSEEQMKLGRIQRIAIARNRVLELIKEFHLDDFEYLMMVDLDLNALWPIDEIINTINSSIQWDCVGANGIIKNGIYYDRFAFRDKNFPFGPEIFGNYYWVDLRVSSEFSYLNQSDWISVYSAFGGLALYKTKSIINYAYSATVTEDLKKFYQKLIVDLYPDRENLSQYKRYLSRYTFGKFNKIDPRTIPVLFYRNTEWEDPNRTTRKPLCCEHVTLHASMILNGFDRFFINPKMILKIDE